MPEILQIDKAPTSVKILFKGSQAATAIALKTKKNEAAGQTSGEALTSVITKQAVSEGITVATETAIRQGGIYTVEAGLETTAIGAGQLEIAVAVWIVSNVIVEGLNVTVPPIIDYINQEQGKLPPKLVDVFPGHKSFEIQRWVDANGKLQIKGTDFQATYDPARLSLEMSTTSEVFRQKMLQIPQMEQLADYVTKVSGLNNAGLVDVTLRNRWTRQSTSFIRISHGADTTLKERYETRRYRIQAPVYQYNDKATYYYKSINGQYQLNQKD